jgi:hypothetical protein
MLRIIKAIKGSPDGIEVYQYNPGEVFEKPHGVKMSPKLWGIFVEHGYGEEFEPPPVKVITPPENKVVIPETKGDLIKEDDLQDEEDFINKDEDPDEEEEPMVKPEPKKKVVSKKRGFKR